MEIIVDVLDLSNALTLILVMLLALVCPVISSDDGIDLPQKVLFAPERLNLKWTQVHRIGAGLQNMGNTCFLNSALQCLTYTPPFANYMLTREHSKTCTSCVSQRIFVHYSHTIIITSIFRHFSIIHELFSSLIHVLLITLSSICSRCRSRAGVLYDVHHAKPHHSGLCQLWECH